MNLGDGISVALKYQQQGNKAAARDVLRKILAIDKRHEEAWMLFSELAESKKDEILCLRNVLNINPANQRAGARLVDLTQPSISPPVYYPPPEEEEPGPAPERSPFGAGKINLLQRVLWSIGISFIRREGVRGDRHRAPGKRYPTSNEHQRPVGEMEIRHLCRRVYRRDVWRFIFEGGLCCNGVAGHHHSGNAYRMPRW
jgi:hypothetical protein